MKLKKDKILLITIGVVIITIIVIASIILIFRKKEEQEPVYVEKDIQTEEKQLEETEKQTYIDESKYYRIAKLVRRYYGALNKSGYVTREGESFAEEASVKGHIYNMISKEYIERENITVEKIYDYVPDITETVTFIPHHIEVSEGMGIDKYLVYGTIIDMLDNSKYSEIQIFVNIDNRNNTFSIEPISGNEEVEINNAEESIEKNSDNTFEPTIMDEQEISKEKFYNLKLLLLGKSEKLYDMFDEEYRSKKFENYQGYVKYIEDNYERLSTMYIKKYQVKDYDNYKQYICLDQNGNYFIFNTADANNTKIILDTYTVDLPEFVEKYNKANDSTKVGYNIERFVSAINDKDYKYAYDCLDEVYRKNNIPTLEEFENYIKQNLYDKNKVEHTSMEKQGNNYIAEITVKDEDNSNATGKKLTVIMRLEEGTDFTMSFSMN